MNTRDRSLPATPRPRRVGSFGGALILGVVLHAFTVEAAPLQVVQVSPPRNRPALSTTAVTIDFDKPLDPTSVTAGTFRVFGRVSGAKTGVLSFSNGNQRVTFFPNRPFSAGETVRVNLSHAIAAADLTTLRPAGYFFQFQVVTRQAGTFQQIAVMSNRTNNLQTRIYGAAATDLNHDGYADLATINEVSADIRVFLSRADGTGLYQPFLSPQTIGVESSPNDPADFNNDGNTDLCIAATESNSVWVMLGAGDGTFYSSQEIPVGDTPHAIASIDVDGDGDPDIVNANQVANSLVMMINDGNGVFGPATPLSGGVNAEYGLAAADMNNDGICDLVVAGLVGQEIRVQLGNGDGTFTPAGPSQPSGGNTWVVVVDDINGDGNLDAATANSISGNGAILLGDGLGHFGAPDTITTGGHTPSVDLGDLDGDGDPDLVLSVFENGFWRYYVNDGTGIFTLKQEFTALNSPSCSVLYDFDNDGDLDMALTDELADVLVLMRNLGTVDAPPRGAGAFALLPNLPNPFADGTLVRFVLPAAAEVRLDVFDLNGRRVAGVDPVRRAAGPQDLFFDGRDLGGDRLSAGVYWYRLAAGNDVARGKMVLAR
jgi:FG-GAP-like repeat/Bacterial Ig-like domain